MSLPNLINHIDTTDMTTLKKWREIRSNSRDGLLARSQNAAVDVDCSAGGTIVLTVNQREPVSEVRLTGSPGGAYTVEFADGQKQIIIENVSGQTATIETATGATTPPTVLAGDTAILHIRGTDISVSAVVGLEDGALLHSGQVNPTGNFDWAGFEIRQAHLVDYACVVTSPSSSGGILTLDVSLGNYFDVTLTENVNSIVIINEPGNGFSGILLEDGSGVLQLEDGTGNLIQEENSKAANVYLIARQDGTGGWEITFPVIFKWERDTALSPSQSLGPNELDIFYMFKVNTVLASYLAFEQGFDLLQLEDGSGNLLIEESGSEVWFAHQIGKDMG